MTMTMTLAIPRVLSHWSHGALIAAVPVWVGSAAFSLWVLGVRLDAADARRPEPAWVTRWGGPVLLLALVAFLTICVTTGVAVRNARSS
jgi:hypothetical protein